MQKDANLLLCNYSWREDAERRVLRYHNTPGLQRIGKDPINFGIICSVAVTVFFQGRKLSEKLHWSDFSWWSRRWQTITCCQAQISELAGLALLEALAMVTLLCYIFTHILRGDKQQFVTQWIIIQNIVQMRSCHVRMIRILCRYGYTQIIHMCFLCT